MTTQRPQGNPTTTTTTVDEEDDEDNENWWRSSVGTKNDLDDEKLKKEEEKNDNENDDDEPWRSTTFSIIKIASNSGPFHAMQLYYELLHHLFVYWASLLCTWYSLTTWYY
jgi:hypothetical protein